MKVTSFTINREDLKGYALQNYWEVIDWYELPFYKKWFKKKPIKKLVEYI